MTRFTVRVRGYNQRQVDELAGRVERVLAGRGWPGDESLHWDLERPELDVVLRGYDPGEVHEALEEWRRRLARSVTVVRQISLGVEDDVRAARFWAGALGYVRRPPRFAGDDWIVLEPPAGVAGVAIALDVSGSPAEEFPRVHLDLSAGDQDLDAEVERLVGLGARRVEWDQYPKDPRPEEAPYVVLADTEGNRFCVEGRRG